MQASRLWLLTPLPCPLPDIEDCIYQERVLTGLQDDNTIPCKKLILHRAQRYIDLSEARILPVLEPVSCHLSEYQGLESKRFEGHVRFTWL